MAPNEDVRRSVAQAIATSQERNWVDLPPNHKTDLLIDADVAIAAMDNHVLALAAAERDACFDVADEIANRALTCAPKEYEDGFADGAGQVSDAIRARADTDAKAALAAHDKRVGEKALREAVSICRKDALANSEHLALAIEALIEKDQTDE